MQRLLVKKLWLIDKPFFSDKSKAMNKIVLHDKEKNNKKLQQSI